MQKTQQHKALCLAAIITLTIAYTLIQIETKKHKAGKKNKAETIGKGSFGTVLKIPYKESANGFAAKKTIPRYKVLKDLYNILKTIKKNPSENIIKIYKHPTEEDIKKLQCIQYIMSYNPHNKDLYEHYEVEKNKLTEEISFQIIRGLLSALKHLHRLKISHLDLKPENILLDPRTNVITVIDPDGGTYDRETTKRITGSIQYMAPEVMKLDNAMRNKAEGTTRYKAEAYSPYLADIWSSGAIAMFLCLHLDKKTPAATIAATAMEQIYQLIKHPKDVGRLKDIISKMHDDFKKTKNKENEKTNAFSILIQTVAPKIDPAERDNSTTLLHKINI